MENITTISWQEFLTDCKQFIELSKQFNDPWNLCEQNEQDGGIYLVYKNKIYVDIDNALRNQFECKTKDVERLSAESSVSNCSRKEIVQMEYHIMYSLSYQVPVLYFKGHTSDGRPLSLEDSWQIFNTTSNNCKKNRAEMLSIITEADHPILFKSFLLLHPCRTAEILAQAGQSQNRIITFLSIMGPSIGFSLRNEYGLLQT